MDQQSYQVVVTQPAQQRYQEEVLNYLIKYFSTERAILVDQSILDSLKSLSSFPERGKIEESLNDYKEEFRYILFKETRNVELKIIYYLDSSINTVYVTDIFPVLMHPEKIKKRN